MAVAIRRKKQTSAMNQRKAAPNASAVFTARVDERGRVTLPAKARQALGVQPGTVFYIKRESDGFRLARSENPFDALARYAISEDDAGRTRDIREYAQERQFDLSGE
jgi:AbrB family looped-hinge helix DNA binding protein